MPRALAASALMRWAIIPIVGPANPVASGRREGSFPMQQRTAPGIRAAGGLLLAGTVAAVSAAAPVAATAASAGPGSSRTSWTVDGDLYGVVATSARDVWAVGNAGSDGRM